MTSVVGWTESHSSDFGQLQSFDAETSVWKHVFRQAQFYQRICRTLVKLSDIHWGSWNEDRLCPEIFSVL